MPELVRAVLETRKAAGITVAESFERICRTHGIDDGKRDDLNHAVREYIRLHYVGEAANESRFDGRGKG